MFKLNFFIAILLVVCCSPVLAQDMVTKAGDDNQKVVALTFDDGTNNLVLPELLDVLNKEQIKATFFMVGKKLKANTGLVTRALAAGHEIGNHSMTHKKLSVQSEEEIKAEIEGFQRLFTMTFNYTPKVFRAPYLKHNEHVWRILTKNRLPSIGASIGTKDAPKQTSPEDVLRRATENAHPGAIILMHERQHTLQALPQIIKFYQAQGYSFVTVSELLKFEAARHSAKTK